MTTTRPAPSSAADAFPAELLEGVRNTLETLPDRRARGHALHGLIEQAYAAVAWHYDDPYYEELVSLRRIVDEVGAHCERLALLDELSSGSDG